jgi:amino acid adenylation domain-containing protein
MTSSMQSPVAARGKTPFSVIHAWIAARAAQAPLAVAIRSGQKSLTYVELEAKSNALAGLLRAGGVGPGSLVATAFPGCPEAIVAIVAVLKSGAAYVPVDFDRTERSNFILRDTEPKVLLTLDAFTPRFATEVVSTLAVDFDALPSATASDEAGRRPVTVGPRDLAYVIYTSGSTGNPKGVCVEHGSLCNLVSGQIDAFAITPASVVLQFASLTFDASVSEIFTALCAGASLRVADRQELTPGEPLLATLRDGVTVVTLPPSLLTVLPEDRLPDLATVVSAGERCMDQVIARWSKGRRFINAYGPTEATVCATMHRGTAGASGAVVGSPLPGVAAYILDGHGRELPHAAKGELYLSGACLARGYWKQPELTAARFMPDPFSSQPGARMYRTGDLARCTEQGWIEFLGRSDFQVKLRGFRIEPGEVEQALLSQPDITDAAVVADRAGTPEARLVAYVVLRAPTISEFELKRRLREFLPGYMIPSQLIPIAAMPVTASGKIDRSSLPPPNGSSAGSIRPVMPRTAVEQALVQVWREVLGVDAIGVTDDFFELGGNSITAVRVIMRIEEIWATAVPVAELLEDRTIQHLASLVHQARSLSRPRSLISKIQPLGAEPPLLLCHILGGGTLCYLGLARHLTGRQPAWGVESTMIHRGAPPPASLREAAISLADAVSEQYGGPYRIGGWSFGGILAFELALAMERQGKSVEHVFLLDPGPPGPMVPDAGDFLEMVAGYARRSGAPFQAPDYAGLHIQEQIKAMQKLLANAMPPATAAALVGELRASAAHIAIRQSYRPGGVCTAPITLIRAVRPTVDDTAGETDPTLWARLTRGAFDCIDVDCGHGGILAEPHVTAVAEAILGIKAASRDIGEAQWKTTNNSTKW